MVGVGLELLVLQYLLGSCRAALGDLAGGVAEACGVVPGAETAAEA